MLLLLSPAKRLRKECPTYQPATQPALLGQAEVVANVMKGLSARQLRNAMDISPALAELNVQRYADWQIPFTSDNAVSAMYLFQGDVYVGLDAMTFSAADRRFAQKHLRILSGLYGVLRPLDLIQEYRLMMGTKVPVNTKKSLYTFWGSQITDQLKQDVLKTTSPYIVNLASNEYAKAVQFADMEVPYVTIGFRHRRGKEYKNIGVLSKKARGMVARYAVLNRIEDAEQLKEFAEAGYSYNEAMSSDTEWIFTNES